MATVFNVRIEELPRAYPIGEDSDAPEFFIRFDDETRARVAGRWLHSLGYEVGVRRERLRHRWAVRARGAPEYLDLPQAVQAFGLWAASHGGVYRGRRRPRPLVRTVCLAVVGALGQWVVSRYMVDANFLSHLIGVILAVPVAAVPIALIERNF